MFNEVNEVTEFSKLFGALGEYDYRIADGAIRVTLEKIDSETRVVRYQLAKELSKDISSLDGLEQLFKNGLEQVIVSARDCTGKWFSNIQEYEFDDSGNGTHVIYDYQLLDV